MDIENLAAQVHSLLKTARARVARPVPRLALFMRTQPTEVVADLYEPVICLILQGGKQTTFGEQTLDLLPGDSLLVSHDMPVRARVTEASPEVPYLSIILLLDLPLLRSLYEEVGQTQVVQASPRSAMVTQADSSVIDALGRYVALAHDPVEQAVLAPLILREIHFRLLMAPHGGMLRELLRHDSHASNVSRAIARIRRDFRTPLVVPELAREVGMSASSFHKHFRDITSSTPLQYQKELRLLEARRMLAVGEHTVSTVAYDVGYGSPTQFSREYARKFGVPPSAHRA
ncbi:MAG: AraC-like DNA-binding protein [Myxococcota bacterium]|jgi:AraC-like DNA-binding protein